MKILDEMFKYGFHDTDIKNIFFFENHVDMYFENGLYLLDNKGNETVLTPGIIMRIYVDTKFCNLEENISITRIKPSYKNIKLKGFMKYLERDLVGVNNVFFSGFNNGVLFECGFKKEIFYLLIECCFNVEFIMIK